MSVNKSNHLFFIDYIPTDNCCIFVAYVRSSTIINFQISINNAIIDIPKWQLGFSMDPPQRALDFFVRSMQSGWEQRTDLVTNNS